jgi:uncharacterized membrane protein YjjP (DUF1212 family)
MMKSGAEVYRVEDTVERICRCCGIDSVECFATTTGIIISVGGSWPDIERSTAVKKVRSTSIDLEKISRINDSIRCLEAKKTSLDECASEIDAIDSAKPFSLAVRIGALALIGAFYTMASHGSLIDGVCAMVIAILTYLFSLCVEKLNINRFIVISTSCFVSAALSLLIFNLGIGDSLAAIIIGGVTVYLPGVAITNAARDLLSGDMLSGLSRVAESLLTAVAIAGGAGILLNFGPDAAHPDANTYYQPLLYYIFAALGTMGIAIIVNIPRRRLLLASLIAGLGAVVFHTLIIGGASHVLACFAGACVAALFSEIATRATGEAATLFIIPAIFPLVPGIGMYNTMSAMIDNQFGDAVTAGSEALFSAGGIAFGLLVVISLTRIASRIIAHQRKSAV